MDLDVSGGDGPAEASSLGFLSFTVGQETWAVDLATVQEIIRVPPVFTVPLSPVIVEGLVNLRGHVLPVLNAGRALGFESKSSGKDARVVVLRCGSLCGLLVDAVAGVITGEPEPLPAAEDPSARDFLSGILRTDSKVVMLLNPGHLVRRAFASLSAAESLPIPGQLLAESPTEADSEAFRYLTFMVADQEFGLPVESVREIARLPGVLSRVPHAASHLMGIATLRKKLLSLVNLRALLGLPRESGGGRQRIVVLAGNDGARLGLVVDEVREVLHSDRQPEALPPLWERPEETDLQGLLCLEGGRRLVTILAGDQLLRSVLPQLEMEDEAMTEDTGNSTDTEAESAETLVVFMLGAQEFGVPVSAVREILRVPEQFSRVPGAADFVEGMVNLRGHVLSVLDQRRRLGLTAVERSRHQRILVLEAGTGTAGFVVDAVRDVLKVPRTSLAPAPALSDTQTRVVHQVANLVAGGRMIMVLDPDELLRGTDLPAAGEAA